MTHSAMQMFPFNPSAPPTNLPLHIPPQDNVPAPQPSSFDSNEPFPNDPFLANMSADPPQPPATAPNAPTQSNSNSRDFFGDLESAFAIPASSQPQPSSQDDPFNNVLDDALTLPSSTPPAPPLHQSSQPANPHPSAHQPHPFPAFHYSSAPAPSAPAPLAPSLVPQHHRFVQPPSTQPPQPPQPQPHPQPPQPARLAPHHPPGLRPQPWQQHHHQPPVQQHHVRHHPPQHPFQPQQHLQHLHQLTPQLPVPHSQTPLHSRPQHILPHQQPQSVQPVPQQSLPQAHPPPSAANSVNPTASFAQVHPRPVSSIPPKVMDPAALLRSQAAPNLMYRPESFPADGGVIHPSFMQPPTVPGTSNVASAIASASSSGRTQEGSSITAVKKKTSARKQQRRPRKSRGSAASSPAHSLTTRDSVSQQQHKQTALGVQPPLQLQSRILPQQMPGAGNNFGTATQDARQAGVAAHVGQELRQSPQQLEQIRQLQTRFFMQQQQQQQQQERRRAASAVLGNGRQDNSFPVGPMMSDASKPQQFDLRATPQPAGAGGAESNGIAQIQRNEVPNIAKFDIPTIENALARTTDPKVYAALRQQLDLMRRNVASRGVNQVPGTIQGQETDKDEAKVGRIPTGAAVGHQQQLQGIHRQQQPQVVQQTRFQGQKQVAPESVQGVGLQGVGHAIPAGLAYRGQISGERNNVLNPHANRSMASLPQHIQHQIQAQIQARHIQTQLQSQSQFSKQRASQENPLSVPASSSNHSSVFSAGHPSVEERGRKEAPRPATAGPAQANGTMLPLAASSIDPHTQLLTSSMPHAATKGNTHGVTGPGRRRTASQSQEMQMSQMSQSQISALHAMNIRKKEENEKLEAQRKRFALEAELRDVAERKKKRLANAPWNDLSSVLSPDYWTPFSGVSDAWQRLVPYHMLLPKNRDGNTVEKWSAEVESLCEKYSTWLRALKGKFNGLCEWDYENVATECADYGTGALNDDDCIAMEQVLLEDAFETARKEKALADKRAQEMERRQAMDAQARKLAEQSSVALAVAQQNAMRASQAKSAVSLDRRPEYATNAYGVPSAISSVPVSQHGMILTSPSPGALAQIHSSTATPVTAFEIQSRHMGRSSTVQPQVAENTFQGASPLQRKSGTRISPSGSQPILQSLPSSAPSGIQHQGALRINKVDKSPAPNQGLPPSSGPMSQFGIPLEEKYVKRSVSMPSAVQERQPMLIASRPAAGQQVGMDGKTNSTALNHIWRATPSLNNYSADLATKEQQTSQSIPANSMLQSTEPLKEAVHGTPLGNHEIAKTSVSSVSDAAGLVGSYKGKQSANEVGRVGPRPHVTGYTQSMVSQPGTASGKGEIRIEPAPLHGSFDTKIGTEARAAEAYPSRDLEVTESRLPSLTNVQQSSSMRNMSQMRNGAGTSSRGPTPAQPVLKPQEDGRRGNQEVISPADGSGSLEASLSPQKDKGDDGTLSQQVGLQSWNSMGVPGGDSQHQGGSNRGTEMSGDTGSKERRGMGMGSLLNSEGN